MGFLGKSLKNKTLGIVGMGRIGNEVSKRCHYGWNMKILYNDEYNNKEADTKLNATKVSFDELLANSDFISVHLPLTSKTLGMFNKEAFGKMKNSAIFINTSRGDIQNQKDLYEALKSKTIWGAGLDVTSPEPMTPNDDFLKLENVFITPHIGSADEETR